MKKHPKISLLFLLLPFALASCGKADNDVPSDTVTIPVLTTALPVTEAEDVPTTITTESTAASEPTAESSAVITSVSVDDRTQTPTETTTTAVTTEVNAAVSETSITSSETVQTTTATAALAAENNPDWALFLVNQTHPLPEDYKVETAWLCKTYRDYYVDARIVAEAKQMLEDAKSDGINLNVISAYRSYDYQVGLFKKDVDMYMEQGMTYEEAYAQTALNVAVPGESEHNSGLACDILSDEYWKIDEGFENTKAFAWLSENAYKYGFIMRYPKGKTSITGINYEPWHYRYVGRSHAEKLHGTNLCLEEYVESLS